VIVAEKDFKISSGKGKRAEERIRPLRDLISGLLLKCQSRIRGILFCIINSSFALLAYHLVLGTTNIRMNVLSYLAFLLLAAPGHSRHDEYKLLDGHKVRDNYHSPLPHTYIAEEDLPANFNWGNVNGRSYLTHSLNQHIPQCKSMQWELEL
jgi:hypothetical protein